MKKYKFEIGIVLIFFIFWLNILAIILAVNFIIHSITVFIIAFLLCWIVLKIK